MSQADRLYIGMVVCRWYLDGRCWYRPEESPVQKCEFHSGTGQSLHLNSPRVLWEQPNSHSTDLETKHMCGTFENLQRAKKSLFREEMYSITHIKMCNSFPPGSVFDRN